MAEHKLVVEGNETLFRKMAENIREVFWTGSPDWKEVLYISPAYEKVWGRSCESLYARPLDWLDAVVDADREHVIAAISKKSAGDLSDFAFPEYRILRPDGTERWIFARAYPIRDAEGKVYRIAGIAEDITERKQAEIALRQERDLNRRYLDTAQTLMVALDCEGHITMINRAGCELLGYKEDELLGRNWFTACLPQQVSDKVRSVFRKLLVGDIDAVEYFENPVLCRNGSERLVARHNTVLCDERSKIVGTLSSGTDITKLKQYQLQLESSHKYFKDVFDSANDGMFIVDMRGNFIDINRTAHERLGYSKEEMLATKLSELDTPEFAAQIPERMEQIEKNGMAVFETAHYRKDGSIMPVEISTQIIELQGKKVFLSVVRDITERKLAQDALRESEHHFKQAQELAHFGSWTFDMVGQLKWSDELYRIYGVSPETFTPNTEAFFKLIHPDDQPAMQVWINAFDSGQNPGALEFRCIWPDGTIHYIAGQGELMLDAKGKLHQRAGTAQDITERKQAEADLRIAAAAFESQEGMMITDANKVILKVNRAFTEITGYTAEEAVGQTPKFLQSGRHNKDFYRAMWETIHRTGGWQGEVWDRHKNGKIFPKWLTITAVKSDNGTVTHYVGTHTDITERKAAEEQIAFLAYHDTLTGLPNRRLLLDRLKQSLAASARSGRYGALFLLDLDNFKTLNDTLGHDKGDLLLQQVAQQLLTCVREGDTVARLGGDEFVVMLDSLSESSEETATQAETVGVKMLATLNQPYRLAGNEIRSTPSIGVTLFGGHQNDLDELLKQADLAMYQSKTAGRNTLHFFDPKTQALMTDRAALEADLREGLRQRQFALYYQAQVVGDGRLTGAEVLVRWQHPQRGLVLPAEFIPLAEEAGLIQPLGHWVLEAACAQLVQWAAQPNTAHLTLAVNVSAKQLHQTDFVDQVLGVIGSTGANPHRLKLELTESLLVSNVETVIAKMNALKAHGVGFALDDFGTGYSSLSYLKRLPLDLLKIDRSFVRDILIDPNDAAIARMVIALAESLGLAVMAEGAEIDAQRDFLAHLGCHAYQGYLFGRPLPLDQFEVLLKRH